MSGGCFGPARSDEFDDHAFECRSALRRRSAVVAELDPTLAGRSRHFQSLAIGLAPLLSRGELIQILPEWSEELYPLYAYHPSLHLPPAKVRALLDFIQEIAVRS